MGRGMRLGLGHEGRIGIGSRVAIWAACERRSVLMRQPFHTQKERHRFYNFSLRSFRETEAILRVADIQDAELVQLT